MIDLESTLLKSNPTITPWDLYVVGWLGNKYASHTPRENTARVAKEIADLLIKLRPKTPEELGIHD